MAFHGISLYLPVQLYAMKTRLLLSFVAALLLAACTGTNKGPVSVYVWHRLSTNPNMDSLQKDFHIWKSKGVTGVCLDARSLEGVIEASRRAHEEGLEYHAWVPSMLRSNLPHDWYAVNRLGQSADDSPNYLKNYRFLDPANPKVQEYLIEQYTQIAMIPDVDYVRMDFIRYPDVILAQALGELYGIETAMGDRCPDTCHEINPQGNLRTVKGSLLDDALGTVGHVGDNDLVLLVGGITEEIAFENSLCTRQLLLYQ